MRGGGSRRGRNNPNKNSRKRNEGGNRTQMAGMNL